MKQNIGDMGYTDMRKNEKFEPKDSEQRRPKADRTVKHAKDRDYQEEEPTIIAPALKRKYSEQPPTKHNSKT